MPRSKHRPTGRMTKRKQTWRSTTAPEAGPGKKRLTPRQFMLRRAVGWTEVGVGVAIFLIHLAEHTGLVTVFPKALDGLYYAASGAFVIGGIMLLTKYSI